jgi:putative transposase
VATKNSESVGKSGDFRSVGRSVADMNPLHSELFSWLACRFRGRVELELEVIALRHQLAVLRRQRPGRARLCSVDRLVWIWLYRVWPRFLNVVVVVKPATVVQWHRKGFRLYWRWRSKLGRPSINREVRDVIRQMSGANPLWGAPRTHGELLKVGIEVSQATVAKYMVSDLDFLTSLAKGSRFQPSMPPSIVTPNVIR